VSRQPTWLPRTSVLAIHDRLIAEHGGATGSVDENRLESARARPQHQHAYGRCTLFTLAAAYAFGVAKGHPFRDGNKRVALTLAGVFLELNGWRLEAPETEAASMTIGLAAGEVGEADYAAWLESASVRAPRPRRP
jgi:death-on-curing protein